MNTVVLPPRWEQVRRAAQAIADDTRAPAGEREAARGRIAVIEAKYGQPSPVSYVPPYVNPNRLFTFNTFADDDPDWSVPIVLDYDTDAMRKLFEAINHGR